MKSYKYCIVVIILNSLLYFGASNCCSENVVIPGIDCIFQDKYVKHLLKKNVSILTNHTGVTSSLESSITFLTRNSAKYNYNIVSIFTPEHGLKGTGRNSEKISDDMIGEIKVYSLYGNTKRPTDDMLKDVDVIIYDIQDVGVRCFTYITTLFYTMEEAAKRGIKVIVADRPNPMGGKIIDGPMVDPEWISFYSFINVPFVYGMTIGELASFFNIEHSVHCNLVIVPMVNWKRSMLFAETGMHWIPPSPHMPEPDTPMYYPMTVALGKLNIVNVGVGYTLPFKVVGAPWIDRYKLTKVLNSKGLLGIKFYPYSFKPQYDLYAGEVCHGVRLFLTNSIAATPSDVQFTILNALKELYSAEVNSRLSELLPDQCEKISQILGNGELLGLRNHKLKNDWNAQISEFNFHKKKYLIREY